jgi:hypothetical protein
MRISADLLLCLIEGRRSELQVYVDIMPTGESIDVLVTTKKLVVQIKQTAGAVS